MPQTAIPSSLFYVADRVFRHGPVAEPGFGEHALKTEVFVNLWPVDAGIGKIEIFALALVGIA